MYKLDLSGIWTCKSEDGTIDGKVTLPGSLSENGIGVKQEYYDTYEKERVRAPRERYEYIGAVTYEREIEIPSDWDKLSISLFFERINFASKVWIDGVQIGRGVVSLSTPHEYVLTDRVDAEGKPLLESLVGKHILKVEVDNSNFLNLGDMASGYSVDTQGYWNGIIGRMEMIARPVCHIESVQVFPDPSGIRIATVTRSDRHAPMQIQKATLCYRVILPNGETLQSKECEIELFSARQRNHYLYELSEEERFFWSEFHPILYTLEVTLKGPGFTDCYEQPFGLRTLEVKDKQFTLNNRPISLRGTINCAQYPLTGYPPMDTASWKKHFATFKEYGLNHVRFHAWCPPKAAFVAADELGLYLSVEMPLWLNRDVTPMELGDDAWHTFFFREEGHRMLDVYGNHPSFLFFPNGNENLGDYAFLEDLSREFKACDARHLYTLTSNFDHPLSPVEDYLSAFEIQHYRARIQFLHDEVGEGTNVNYDEMASNVEVPFMSFEVGQYCVYPDVDVCEKYTGNMLPVNFDLIRKMMKEKGVYERLSEYIKASGDLAAKLYKEDIEAVLRTRKMGGFQLLSLVDYTGQSTATVGLLDIFHESKNVVSKETWTGFCNEVVPLLEAKRIFSNKECLTGTVFLYDYGEKKIEQPTYEITIADSQNVYKKLKLKGDGKLSFAVDLCDISRNTMLTVSILVKGNGKVYANSWRIFVYSTEFEGAMDLITSKEALENAFRIGGRYVATKEAFPDMKFSKNSFVPVFWSPVHFPSKDPVGAIIQKNHPVLNFFPTDEYLDYQWKYLMEHSVSLEISKPEEDVEVVVEMVPNFVDNVPKTPLCVLKKENAEVLFVGFDLSKANPSAKALYESIYAWMHNE